MLPLSSRLWLECHSRRPGIGCHFFTKLQNHRKLANPESISVRILRCFAVHASSRPYPCESSHCGTSTSTNINQYQLISTNINNQEAIFQDNSNNSKSVHGRSMLEASCGIGRMVFELWSMVFAKLKRTRLRATYWMSASGRVWLCGASTVFLMS